MNIGDYLYLHLHVLLLPLLKNWTWQQQCEKMPPWKAGYICHCKENMKISSKCVQKGKKSILSEKYSAPSSKWLQKMKKSIWGARPRSRKGVISEVKQVARQVQLWGHLHNQKCTKVKSKRNTNDKNDYNLNDTNVVTNNYDEKDKNVVENTNGSKSAAKYND